jgi:hypothetical protein
MGFHDIDTDTVSEGVSIENILLIIVITSGISIFFASILLLYLSFILGVHGIGFIILFAIWIPSTSGILLITLQGRKTYSIEKDKVMIKCHYFQYKIVQGHYPETDIYLEHIIKQDSVKLLFSDYYLTPNRKPYRNLYTPVLQAEVDLIKLRRLEGGDMEYYAVPTKVMKMCKNMSKGKKE